MYFMFNGMGGGVFYCLSIGGASVMPVTVVRDISAPERHTLEHSVVSIIHFWVF
jgi:hypothetical protein